MARYFCLNPHPKAIAKWQELNFLPDKLRCHDQEEQFLAAIGDAKTIKLVDPQAQEGTKARTETIVTETNERHGQPITREIKRFLRVKHGDKEYITFFEELRGETFSGEPQNKHRWVGKFEEPQGNRTRNRLNGTLTTTGLGEMKTVYEIPFGRGKFTDPSTGEQTTLDDLPRGEQVMYYVKTVNRLYALTGITYDEYMNSPFEYLVDWGMAGKRPEKKPDYKAAEAIVDNTSVTEKVLDVVAPREKARKVKSE